MKLSVLVFFFFLFSLCQAQETGCFKPTPGDEIALETNIDFNNYNAFFVGEFHGVYGVPEIKLALIRYVNKHCGVTDVFMEISYSAAYLYNAYLATGDTTLFTRPEILYGFRKQERDFWKKLYEYNKGLDHKLTIRGMDFERTEFLKVLKILMPPGKEKPAGIAATLTYIDTIDVNRVAHIDDILDTTYYDIRKKMKNNRAIYEQYYGASFNIVADIMFNKDKFKRFNMRNKTMYHNMVQQIERDNITKFITFNGLAHGDMNNKSFLAGALKKNKRFKDKFADIAMICKDCYDSNGTFSKPHGGVHNFEAPYSYIKDEATINDAYDRHFNKGCKYTLLPSTAIGNNKASKYSDYILLIRDQPVF